jgi:hypothetical protein
MWGIAVIKPNVISGNQRIIAGWIGTAAARFIFGLGATGNLACYVANGSTAYIGRLSNAAAISANTAYVVSFTYDGGTSSSGIKLYRNGTLIDTTDANAGVYTVPTGGEVLRIGNDAVGAGFNGYLLPAAFGQGGVISETSMNFMVRSLMNRFGIS